MHVFIAGFVNWRLPLIFLDPSPAFLMRMTPANPASKSHKYTDDTPPSKYNSRYCDKNIIMKLQGDIKIITNNFQCIIRLHHNHRSIPDQRQHLLPLLTFAELAMALLHPQEVDHRSLSKGIFIRKMQKY